MGDLGFGARCWGYGIRDTHLQIRVDMSRPATSHTACYMQAWGAGSDSEPELDKFMHECGPDIHGAFKDDVADGHALDTADLMEDILCDDESGSDIDAADDPAPVAPGPAPIHPSSAWTMPPTLRVEDDGRMHIPYGQLRICQRRLPDYRPGSRGQDPGRFNRFGNTTYGAIFKEAVPASMTPKQSYRIAINPGHPQVILGIYSHGPDSAMLQGSPCVFPGWLTEPRSMTYLFRHPVVYSNMNSRVPWAPCNHFLLLCVLLAGSAFLDMAQPLVFMGLLNQSR